MNRNELEAAAEQRLFDAALDESVGAPWSGGFATRRQPVRSPRWLVAAMVLLGVAVVAAVVATNTVGPALAVAPQEPAPLPPVVKVRGTAELLALDRSTTNVRFQFGKAEELGELARLPQLRAIHLEPDPDLADERRTTAVWMLSPLVDCPCLEQVTIGNFAELGAVEFTALTRLPKLRSLTLFGNDKVVDAELGALLGNLALRELVLQGLTIRPEGLRAIGGLPRLERLELRDCDGLLACDLSHLYGLRGLRSLALVGCGAGRGRLTQGPGTAVLVELPVTVQLGEGAILTSVWMEGLGEALPLLRELDLSRSQLDDGVIAALPVRLQVLNLMSAGGFTERAVAALAALPELRDFSGGVAAPFQVITLQVGAWIPLLNAGRLRRLCLGGLLTREVLDALPALRGLQELRLECDEPVVEFRYPGGQEARKVPMPVPDFAPLAQLRKLERVVLRGDFPALEAAIRRAVPAGVRIEVQPR